MAKASKQLLESMSLEELQRLTGAKAELDKLEKKRADLAKDLAKVEADIEKLYGSALGGSTPRKATKKKTTRKKRAKRVAKKATKKKVVKKKASKKSWKKTGKKKTAKKRAAKSGATLEDVVVGVIAKAGGKSSFQDIKAKIVKGKLYKSKAKDFDNVLRRTISTSEKIVRRGRGVYGVE